MFQNLHTVVLRRATHLRDRALAALAAANGPRLKVHMSSFSTLMHYKHAREAPASSQKLSDADLSLRSYVQSTWSCTGLPVLLHAYLAASVAV